MSKKLNIFIPALGKSKRFKDAGIFCEKYFLPLNNNWSDLVIDKVIKSFPKKNCNFFFGVSKSKQTELKKFLKMRKVAAKIIVINQDTHGQAETVKIMIDKSKLNKADTFFIFNIDTAFNYHFNKSYYEKNNCLDVFLGKGNSWSFLKLNKSKEIEAVYEKKRVSNFCSTGLYQFASIKTYNFAYKKGYNDFKNNSFGYTELFVAPLYNYLIKDNKKVIYRTVDKAKLRFYGTPKQYFNNLKKK